MTAACIGAFVIAESGLLDRYHANTICWLSSSMLKHLLTVS